ncbi:MAG: anhydro-N-acetylmuramic acid kinase [Saprospiraceae bacterium]
MTKSKLTICGVMSGSSLDGLDMAICSFEPREENKLEWNIDRSSAVAFPDQLAADIMACYESSSAFIYKVEQDFTEFCALSLKEFIGQGSVDYIGYHGHTIFHEPDRGYTTQIGNAHHLAQKLGIKVIAQFRNKDVALGGQGAPLAPIVEKYLFPEYTAFLNLGGIVNIGIHNNENISAYDITACNQALNHLSSFFNKKYDNNGEIASTGSVDPNLLNKLNLLDFLNQEAPKSLSNTWVHQQFIPILDNHKALTNDKMATTVSHIATEIAKECQSISQGGAVMASGGGVHNGFMMDEIKNNLAQMGISIIKPSDTISEYKEALLMALMAYLRVYDVPNCLASVTGASRDSCTGIIFNPQL